MSSQAFPGAHVTQRKIARFATVTKRRAPFSLQSPIVQPDSPSADDHQDIIDAAYGCLSEPHTGPVPVAAILDRAGLSTRAFYRHFASKDELFLAMLRQVADALTDRLDRIVEELAGNPVKQLTAWVDMMFNLAHDPQLRVHLTVIDSDEVRAAKGYRDTRERLHADRERSLVAILERGRADGSFPLTQPQRDAVAISAIVSRELTVSGHGRPDDLQRARNQVLDFVLRALGANRSA